jgi:hypothetical protein
MWTPFNFFIGAWKGSGQGQQGHSRVERKYKFVLKDKFLFVQNKSIYEPQEKNPKGEIHEDWGFISYDRERQTYIFRQFHIEGFVNQYLLDKIAEDEQTISFVTEAIENISPGWRAKESYRILGPDEFIEVFELAAPDKDFKIYTENRFQRIRSEEGLER